MWWVGFEAHCEGNMILKGRNGEESAGRPQEREKHCGQWAQEAGQGKGFTDSWSSPVGWRAGGGGREEGYPQGPLLPLLYFFSEE